MWGGGGGGYRKCNKSISSLYLFLFFSFNTNSALHLSVWLLSVWLETQSSCMVGQKKMKRKDKRPQMQREILDDVQVNCSFNCDADENVDYNSKPHFSHYPCYDVD